THIISIDGSWHSLSRPHFMEMGILHPYNLFQRQFLLTKGTPKLPDSWTTDSTTGWQLYHHPTLNVVEIKNSAGQKIGWLLGHLIDLKTKNEQKDAFVLPFTTSESMDERHAKITTMMRSWAGCYLIIVVDRDFQRIYPDIGATVPVFFNQDNEDVGSSPAMLLPGQKYWDRLDLELVTIADVNGDGWLPFDVTAHKGVLRLLSNHFLDLRERSMQRYWPDFKIVLDADIASAVDEIVLVLKSTIDAIARSWKMTIQLTAGQDSRTVMACCREHMSQSDAFTLKSSSFSIDEMISKRIARECNIRQHVLSAVISTEKERSDWLLRIGHSSGGSHMRYHRTMEQLDLSHAMITGFGGELNRGRYWSSSDTTDGEITPKQLLGRLDLAQHPRFITAAKSWIKGMAGYDKLTILDVAFVDVPMPGRVSAQLYGPSFTYQDFHPLTQSRIFDRILTLPIDYRRANRLYRDIIARTWPEMNDYPVNSVGLWGDARYKFMKVWNHRRIRRRIRSLIH
ncbi:MAG: hypothetical protein O7G83_05240, partial [Proteobacteria bacterium]|nr:hypothetical protein [Pseudomonadota bacterium]